MNYLNILSNLICCLILNLYLDSVEQASSLLVSIFHLTETGWKPVPQIQIGWERAEIEIYI
jgi:hypothetical protein